MRPLQALIFCGLAFTTACTESEKSGSDDATTSTTGDGEPSDTADGGSGDGGSGDGGSGSGSGGETGDDDGGDDGLDDVDWDSLNGFVPDPPGELPEFTAYHYDTSARTREDLLGDPTVMWFYPAAATSG